MVPYTFHLPHSAVTKEQLACVTEHEGWRLSIDRAAFPFPPRMQLQWVRNTRLTLLARQSGGQPAGRGRVSRSTAIRASGRDRETDRRGKVSRVAEMQSRRVGNLA